MKRFALLAMLLAWEAVLAEPVTAAGSYRLAHTFQAEIPTTGDAFGTAVVLEGGIAAIRSNAGYLDPDLTNITHVYEMEANGSWTEAATFEEVGEFFLGQGNPYIGQELSLSKGVVLMGFMDHARPVHTGFLRFATRDVDNWEIDFDKFNTSSTGGILTASNGLPGRSLDISGNIAIVGDSEARSFRDYDDTSGPSIQQLSGAARIYELNANGEWRQTTNLIPATESERQGFVVNSVGLDGATAVVVDRGDFRGEGGVYFFERSAQGEWTETTKHLAPTDEPTAFFRSMVRIDGDTTLLRDMATGITTLFEPNTQDLWEQTEQIIPPIANQIPLWGAPVAIEGDLLASTVVGAGDDPNHVDLYRRTAPGAWELFDTILDPETTGAADFGASLAIDQGRLLIGAHAVVPDVAFDTQSTAGAAYLFVPVPEPCGLLLISLAAVCSLARRKQLQ